MNKKERLTEYRASREIEICCSCGKPTHRPVYGPRHEETSRLGAYHKACLDKRVKNWNKRYN